KGNGLPNWYYCSLDLQGILFQSASGTVNHVAVRNQMQGDVLTGCMTGKSIYVETATGSLSTVTVENSSVHNYNEYGIMGRDAGTTLTITGNYVQGSGLLPLGLLSQHGIGLYWGATGKISGNTVIDNVYGGPTYYVAFGIVLWDAAENSGITVSTNGNTIKGNTIFNSAESGVHLDASCGTLFGGATGNNNIVTGNTILESAC